MALNDDRQTYAALPTVLKAAMKAAASGYGWGRRFGGRLQEPASVMPGIPSKTAGNYHRSDEMSVAAVLLPGHF